MNFSFVNLVTKGLEALGLLNKGSAQASRPKDGAAPPPDTPIGNNSLNVTRVGGLASFIAAAGAAAIGLFHVDKMRDPHSIVVAAYGGTAAIVAAALITAAIIISTDIRARAQAATAKTPGDQVGATTGAPVSATVFSQDWSHAIQRLRAAITGLETGARQPVSAWLDAAASGGAIEGVSPPPGYAEVGTKLTVARNRIVDRLQALTASPAGGPDIAALREIELILDEMDRTIADLPV